LPRSKLNPSSAVTANDSVCDRGAAAPGWRTRSRPFRTA